MFGSFILGNTMTDYFFDASYLCHFHETLLNSDPHAAALVEKELLKINSPISETNLFIGALPEYSFFHLNKMLEYLTTKGFKSITIIVNNDSKYLPYKLHLLSTSVLEKCKIISLNFLPWFHHAHILKQKNALPSSWNWNKKKGILRTGSLDRYNRIGLLKLLYDQNLLDDIEWTFPASEKQKSRVLNYFVETTGSIPKNFNEFYSYCSTHAITQKNAKMICDVFPQLAEVLPGTNYAGAFPEFEELGNFSIIAETQVEHISERSYIAILYKHPFIIISPPRVGKESQTIEKLKDLGFRTFENYFPFSDYAKTEDNQLRLNQAIENIRVFQKIIEDRREEIAADVEYNYDLCLQIIAETGEKLKNLSPVLTTDKLSNLNFLTFSGVDLDLFIEYKKQEKIILQEKERKEFLEKYEIYRGADWPDIKDENDFQQLPTWIKEECKNKFNFPRKLINRDIINAYLDKNN
jgi:hypothetical protein